jgi:hypothetical protein
MASVANGVWVKEQMDAYKDTHFIKEDGSMDLTTNTVRISKIMRDNGFVQDGKYHVYKDLHVFPTDYFCPRQTTGEILLTDNTYCDHHFMGTWDDNKKAGKVLRLLNPKLMSYLIKMKRKLFG